MLSPTDSSLSPGSSTAAIWDMLPAAWLSRPENMLENTISVTPQANFLPQSETRRLLALRAAAQHGRHLTPRSPGKSMVVSSSGDSSRLMMARWKLLL